MLCVVVCLALAICAARIASGKIVLPSALALDGASTSSSFDSIACKASGQYYDESVLGCNYCVGGAGLSTISDPYLVPDNSTTDLATGCMCSNGSIRSLGTKGACDSIWPAPCTIDKCSLCPSGSVPSKDVSRCMECGNSTFGLSDTIQDCLCPANSILLETNPNGIYLDAKECVQCGNGTYANLLTNTCQPCPDPHMVLSNSSGKCTCGDSYDLVDSIQLNAMQCVATSHIQVISSKVDISGAATLKFSSFLATEAGSSSESVTVTSELYQDIFLIAAHGCYFYESDRHSRYCQVLGNLCVLQHFDSTAASCAFLELIRRSGRSTVANSISGWYFTLPFMGYTASALSIEQDTSIGMEMSFDEAVELGKNDHLEYILARYTVNGTLVGFERLKNQLSICHNDDGNDPMWMRFGLSASKEYSCDLSSLLSTPLHLFELYLIDKSKENGDKGRYIPIPVRNLNYQDENGVFANKNYHSSDAANDFLSHRFFLLDSQSGIPAGQTKPRVVRYAQSITLTIKTQANDVKRIYPPLLTIQYADTQNLDIVSIALSVVYSSDTTSFWSFAVSLLVVACLFASCRAFFHTFTWQRRSTRNEEVASALFHSLLYLLTSLMQNFASVAFIVLLLLSSYYLLFFKLQSSVYMLLPQVTTTESASTTDEYYSFRVLLPLAFSCQFMYTLQIIYRQTQVRLFFVDWEKPRAILLDSDAASPLSAPVSVWRTILVANEWNELQTARRSSLMLTLIVILFLLYGCELRDVALPIPRAQMKYYYASNTGSPGDSRINLNPVLRFANVAWWWIIVYAAQRLWRWAIYERYFDEPRENLFIDLCTVAKVSCLFLDEPYHGFYLHCRSPHPFADGTMGELVDHFRQEEAGMTVGRHLDSTLPECQAFEMFVTRKWKRKFQALMTAIRGEDRLAEEKAAAQRRAERSKAGPRIRGGAGQPASTLLSWNNLHQNNLGPATSAMVSQSTAMADFLKAFIENQTEAFRWRIYRAHTCMTRFLDIPPDMSVSRQSLFLPDAKGSFAKAALFLGIENDLMILNVLCFSSFDLWFGSHATSALATFLLERLLIALRARYGRRNIARNTLVDARFLI